MRCVSAILRALLAPIFRPALPQPVRRIDARRVELCRDPHPVAGHPPQHGVDQLVVALGARIVLRERYREIDRRMRFLSKRLENSEVVDASRQARTGQVFFGATVTYADARDEERTITIVGVDEVDPARGRVSWVSPIARALLKAQVGDLVQLRTPAGNESIEVLSISYPKAGDKT